MTQEKGNISIHTENIFPIIKKFLYSDHEIFLRELVSNGVDACQKLKKLAQLGEYQGELGDLKITVNFDKEAKTITISDNGLGMTADEIKKYINQIAFSGAAEFVEKYKGQDEAGNQIIGHFGLGFYSAFMVARLVEIQTLSHQPDSNAARWVCDGNTEFEISAGTRTERGTDIILHIAEDSEEFLDQYKLKTILTKYGKFLPIDVYLGEEKINNTTPLWTRKPADLKDEDYIAFYKELYPFNPDPLFWIHLNVDYPFNLTGILYFPQIKNELEPVRDKIQLYSRQVFITDEVKDVVPEFLMLLQGVIDSPDIPLNVSRSYLQADGNVKKINSHITSKVAGKLQDLFNQDRKAYEEKWASIGLFVKYGQISEDKFAEKAKSFSLLKNTEGQYFTIEEYTEKIKPNQTDKNDQLVLLYTSDLSKQSFYVDKATTARYDVLQLDQIIDSHYLGYLERMVEKSSLKRVDSEVITKLIDKGEPALDLLTPEQKDALKSVFEGAVGDQKLTLAVEPMQAEDLPIVLTENEFMRRMKDMNMGRGMNMFGDMPSMMNATINANHPLISKIIETESSDLKTKIARQAFDLALLSQHKLEGKALTEFISRTLELSSSMN
jgi:molecular chaperone HtpG